METDVRLPTCFGFMSHLCCRLQLDFIHVDSLLNLTQMSCVCVDITPQPLTHSLNSLDMPVQLIRVVCDLRVGVFLVRIQVLFQLCCGRVKTCEGIMGSIHSFLDVGVHLVGVSVW